MNHFNTTISAIAVLASLQAGGVMAEERPKDIFVIADIAASNSCFTSPEYQRKCLGQLVDKIDGLGLTYLDTLRLRPASSAASSATYWPDFYRDIEFVYRKAEPSAVPNFMAERFSELSKVATGAEADFQWTMTEISRDVRCATHETHIIYIGDSVGSGTFDGNRFGMARLVGTPFEGCASLTLIGFGVNDLALTSTQVRSAELAFTTVGKEAGFGDVGISR